MATSCNCIQLNNYIIVSTVVIAHFVNVERIMNTKINIMVQIGCKPIVCLICAGSSSMGMNQHFVNLLY